MQVADLAPADLALGFGPKPGPNRGSKPGPSAPVGGCFFEVPAGPAEVPKTPQCHIAPQNRALSDQLSRFSDLGFGPKSEPVWGRFSSLGGSLGLPDLG